MCAYMHAQSLQSCSALCDPMDCKPARLLCPQDSPGKNTAVGSHALLQEIFLTQGSNPHFLYLLHKQTASFPLDVSGKPLAICTSL